MRYMSFFSRHTRVEGGLGEGQRERGRGEGTEWERETHANNLRPSISFDNFFLHSSLNSSPYSLSVSFQSHPPVLPKHSRSVPKHLTSSGSGRSHSWSENPAFSPFKENTVATSGQTGLSVSLESKESSLWPFEKKIGNRANIRLGAWIPAQILFRKYLERTRSFKTRVKLRRVWHCKGPYTGCPVGDHIINRHGICVKTMFLGINHLVLPKYFILYWRIRCNQCSRLIPLQELAKQWGRVTAKMSSKDEVVLKT